MLSDPTKSEYANMARKLMTIAQNLRDIGAQSFFDIPRIVVIGSQSTGKSSLVEAISGIHVPRDAGTCTRCPVEVNLLSTPGPWSCRITLRIEFDANGSPLPEPQKVPFGEPLSDIAEVELALCRSQVAILNYPTGLESFVTKSREELEHYRTEEAFQNGTQMFSKNSVVIDIHDEDCSDLSFVDLPGLVQNEDDDVVKFVEDLVRASIQKECLILVTIPMSDEMENQRAMRIALEVDKDRSRTIGVLTKPDMLTQGSTSAHRRWSDLLNGKCYKQEYALKLGYYCVKLPDDAEREANPDIEARKKIEETFFQTPPWNQTNDRGRLGIPNVVTDLSKYLTTFLRNVLPNLRSETQKQITESRSDLIKLPIPPQNAHGEILRRVANFCKGIESTVKGVTHTPIGGDDIDTTSLQKGGKTFVQNNRKVYREFNIKIRRTAPDFRPVGSLNGHARPQCEEMGEEGTADEEGEGSGPLDLEHVKEMKEKSISWELPGNTPFEAKQRLINMYISQWRIPTMESFDSVVCNLVECVDEILQQQFNRFPKLEEYVTDLMREIMDAQWKKAEAALKATLELESFPLFTQNEVYLNNQKGKWLAFYERIYQENGGHDIISWGEELDIMAEVRAYFFVAYRRFIDNVPLTIEHALNQDLANKLYGILIDKLGIYGPGAVRNVDALVVDHPDIETRREELVSRIDRLERVRQELRSSF